MRCIAQKVRNIMFTGLITHIGIIAHIAPSDKGARIKIDVQDAAFAMPLGASIAVNGVCLTVISQEGTCFDADVSAETLSCTTALGWQVGDRVNIEASLKLGDAMGGHIVLGHVDAVGEVIGKQPVGDATSWQVAAPKTLLPLIAQKGSIAVDGISLTVNAVDGAGFSVMVIPHTETHTNLQFLDIGDKVNLEADAIARYVARQMEFRK